MRGRPGRVGPYRLASLRAAILSAAALAACGGEDPKESGSARLVPEGMKLSRLNISVTEPSPGRFRYLAPKAVRGGLVEIRFTNAANAPRKAQLWRVDGGHTVEQALRAGRPLPRWLTWAGGVGLTAPDRTGTAVQRLSRGTYYVTGTGGERRGVAPLRVTEGGNGTRLPDAGAQVTALDYGYRLSGLKPGSTSIEFRNAGDEPHHAFFALLREGRTLEEARAFFAGKAVGPPPVDPEATRESVVLEGGDRQVTHLNLESGRYALLCFVRDRGGGPPHTEKGMVVEVEVP